MGWYSKAEFTFGSTQILPSLQQYQCFAVWDKCLQKQYWFIVFHILTFSAEDEVENYIFHLLSNTLSCALLNCCLVKAQRWLCASYKQSANLFEILYDKRSFPTKFIASNYWLFKRWLKYYSKIITYIRQPEQSKLWMWEATFRDVTGSDKRALNS